MVYYLKYRPKTISELDNRIVANTIAKYLSKPTIPHAFLFTGPKGTGKTSTARILAKTINCKHKKGIENCSNCGICESITKGNQLDVIEIDAASNRGIDEIRDLREKIKLSPLELMYKVYIIDEVHMLTTEAFNALLKTLEEPPSHAVFILATTESHKLPETVKSRCINVQFDKAATVDIIHSLNRIVSGEKLDIDGSLLQMIAEAADGSFRDGAKLIQELALENNKITKAQVIEKIGLVDTIILQSFIDNLRQKQIKKLLEAFLTFEKQGKNIRLFFQEVLKKLELELIKMYSGGNSDWNPVELKLILKALTEAFVLSKQSIIPQLPFELAVVEFSESGKKQNSAPNKTLNPNETYLKPQSSDLFDETSASKFREKWPQIIELIKPRNNSLSGVLRSCKPVQFADGILTIEAAYKFHAERLQETLMQQALAQTIAEVTGSDVTVRTVLKKRI